MNTRGDKGKPNVLISRNKDNDNNDESPSNEKPLLKKSPPPKMKGLRKTKEE
jgi:hypothetical protein